MPPRLQPPLRQTVRPRTSATLPQPSICRKLHTSHTCLNNRPKTDPLRLIPRKTAAACPTYPYPPPQWYKQQTLGLYGSSQLQFGNNVSEKHDTKTRRIWRPNIKVKHMHSRALGRKLRMRVSTRVLRTIDKVGGVDEYVTGGGAGRVRELGSMGWKLRWAVVNSRGARGDPAMKALRGKRREAFYAAAERAVGERLKEKFDFVPGRVRGEETIVAEEPLTEHEPEMKGRGEVEQGKLRVDERSGAVDPTARLAQRARRTERDQETLTVPGHMVEKKGSLPIEEQGIYARIKSTVLRPFQRR